MSDLSSRDYERMLDLIAAMITELQTEPPWPMITTAIKDAVDGTLCMLYDDVRWEEGAGRTEAWSPASVGQLPLDALLQKYMNTHPLAQYYATSNDRTPLRVSDVSSEDAWRRTPTYEIVTSVLQVTHQMALPLRGPTGAVRSFLVSRPGNDFTDRDREFYARIQPLLIGLDSHIRQLRRWRESAPDHGGVLFGEPHERASAHRLTPRELVVLALLAEGRTAASIARRLNISPRTVTTHLDNIYRKLGTRDRLATVMRAQDMGLLPRRSTIAARQRAPVVRGIDHHSSP